MTHYWQLIKSKGRWIVVADSTHKSALVDRRGQRIVEAHPNTSLKRVLEMAEEHGGK